MVIIDNKVANKPHIYFNREKGGWRLQPTYGFNGDQFHLMLGDSHTHTRDFGVANGEANRTLVAVTSLELVGLIGGGGW